MINNSSNFGGICNNLSADSPWIHAIDGSMRFQKRQGNVRTFKSPAFILGEYLYFTFNKVSSCVNYIFNYFVQYPEGQREVLALKKEQLQVNETLNEELGEVSQKLTKLYNEKMFIEYETNFNIPLPIYEEMAKVSMKQAQIYDKLSFIEYETNFNIPSPEEICLLTAYTSDNYERLEMSKKVARNQRDYSEKKGYSYLEYQNNLAVEIDPVTGNTIEWEPYWSKIAAINNILNGKESSLKNKPRWIVWLDDDAVITNQEIDMEGVIHYYANHLINDDLNFFVTTDSFSKVPLNSAVLFIKNNEWSRMFFEKIWEMRNTYVPNKRYTYGNCPAQSCLHEQQAITDLLSKDKDLAKHARIIPQRDPKNPIGINTFVREDHIDLNRQNMKLTYGADNPNTKGKKGDFIQQCTGLSTRAYRMDRWGEPDREMSWKDLFFGINLRLECIDKLIRESGPEEESWLNWLSYQSFLLERIRMMTDLPEAVKAFLNLKEPPPYSSI